MVKAASAMNNVSLSTKDDTVWLCRAQGEAGRQVRAGKYDNIYLEDQKQWEEVWSQCEGWGLRDLKFLTCWPIGGAQVRSRDTNK